LVREREREREREQKGKKAPGSNEGESSELITGILLQIVLFPCWVLFFFGGGKGEGDGFSLSC
jgi:hypothetical protein